MVVVKETKLGVRLQTWMIMKLLVLLYTLLLGQTMAQKLNLD